MTKKKQTKKKTQRKPKKFSQLCEQIRLPLSIDVIETDYDFTPRVDGLTHEMKNYRTITSKFGIYKAVYEESSKSVEIWIHGFGVNDTAIMNLNEFKAFYECIKQLFPLVKTD